MEFLPEAADCRSPESPGRAAIEVLVIRTLHEIGIPTHLKGYQYLREAVILSLEDFHLLETVTTGLYPRIAVRFDTTPSRVERAIRHAIKVAWEKGGLQNYPTHFGFTASAVTRPTNSECISLMVEKLRLEMKSPLS